MTNSVVWFEVMGQDADKLRHFYRELLGFEFRVQEDMNYGTVDAAGGGIPGGVGSADGGPGWVTFYTKVPDLEKAVARAAELGSTTLLPITSLPEVTIAVVTDPEGNAVGLCMDPPAAGA